MIPLETLRLPTGAGTDPEEVAVAGVMYSLSAFDSVLVKEEAILSEDCVDCCRYIGASVGRWGG